ncbi:MAG: FHA domain-containing protein [Planctomycetota bacterium]|jgi:pSer/pThr/pTyr-binding forkhead associated (FHA) protein|nr:FHA domain-containing protein [Planctomycetota bacterium]
MAKVTVLFGNDPQGEFPLEKAEHTIGRARDCDILVDNLGVSRHHCSIVQDGDGWAIVDKGSNNGTFLNGAQVKTQTLKHEDRIVLGKYSLVFDAYGFADKGADKRGATGGMGSEMTMFVDPEAIKQMQEKIKSGGSAPARVALSVMQGGREANCILSKTETTIGKGIDADLPIKGLLVKPIQAKVIKTDQGHRMVSTGGFRSLRVNGAKVSEKTLQPGDVIVIAGTMITYKQV